jgi:hypothetical protein
MTAGGDRPAGTATAWRRAETVLWRRTLDGVIVLAELDGAEPVALRGPAAEIWELLGQPVSVAALTTTLATRYRVPVSEIAADVDRTIDELSELGALCAS